MERLAEGRSGKDNIVIWLESSSSSSKRPLSRLARRHSPGEGMGGGGGGERKRGPDIERRASGSDGVPQHKANTPFRK